MIRQIGLTIAAIAFATPALSLSCVQSDVTLAYKTAAEAKESYIIVTGKLTFKKSDNSPRGYGNDKPASTRVPARLTGRALTKSGFSKAFDRAIILDVLCFGAWCGGAGPGATYLAFLKREGEAYVMETDPCGTMAFGNPTRQMLRDVRQCYAGGRCGR